MKRGVGVLALLVIITIAGGVLTSGVGITIPTIIQSTNPDASPFEATPTQATYLVIWIGFVLLNVVGAGLTMAFLFWLGNRELKVTAEMPTRSDRQQQEALPESS